MRIDDLVAKYIKLRDKKSEFKKEYEDKVAVIDAALEKVEAVFLKHFNETGQDSATCKGVGTAYKTSRASATVADREAYFNWVGADFDERRVFLESRCSKSAVEQFKAANEELPPGINWSETITVNIRR